MKRGKLTTITATILLIISLFSTIFLEDNLSSQILNIVTVITAVIGSVALFFQFKKDKAINESNFIFSFSTSFYCDYDCTDMISKLLDNVDNNTKIHCEENVPQIVRYMQWIESIASIIECGSINLKSIDQVMGYRFFIMVNNKEIQEKEIIPFREHYLGTFKLYKRWYEYRMKNKLPIPLAENSLHLRKEFDEIIQKYK